MRRWCFAALAVVLAAAFLSSVTGAQVQVRPIVKASNGKSYVMVSDSLGRILSGDGVVPRIVTKRLRWGTYTNGIFTATADTLAIPGGGSTRVYLEPIDTSDWSFAGPGLGQAATVVGIARLSLVANFADTDTIYYNKETSPNDTSWTVNGVLLPIICQQTAAGPKSYSISVTTGATVAGENELYGQPFVRFYSIGQIAGTKKITGVKAYLTYWKWDNASQ